MKKFFIIWFMLLFIIGCDDLQREKGLIIDKGIDKVDLTAMYESISIQPADNDEKFQELYWIKVRGFDKKIFVNQFCYEDSEIGEIISLTEDNADIRFITEY